MSAQAPLKERIEDKSAKGAGNEESANGAGNEESAKGAANNEIDKGTAPDREEPITNKSDKDHSQESSSVSIADKNAKAMTDLMWQEHPSVQAHKSAKTVFFEENAKGSSPK
jgi:hypothetical protein